MKSLLVADKPAVRSIVSVLRDLFGCDVFKCGSSHIKLFFASEDEARIVLFINTYTVQQ